MHKRFPGVGLDIGCYKTRLVKVTRRRSELYLSRFGSMATPADMVKGGCISDPEGLGTALRYLAKELRLENRRVVASLTGQHVFLGRFFMPSIKPAEMKKAVYYQAMKLLPIPIEDTIMHYYETGEIRDYAGKQTEIFFVAVSKQQVENMKLACRVAGFRLVALEFESQALYRIVNSPESITALLNIGWSRAVLSIFVSGLPVFMQNITPAKSIKYGPIHDMNLINALATHDLGSSEENKPAFIASEFIREVVSAVQSYQRENSAPIKTLETIWINGGEYMRDLENELNAELGCHIERAGFEGIMRLGGNVGQVVRNELQRDYLIALGLAAREGY